MCPDTSLGSKPVATSHNIQWTRYAPGGLMPKNPEIRTSHVSY